MDNLWKKTDGILFDLDGTLWDAVDNVAAAWNLGAQKVDASVELAAADVRSIMGLTAEGIQEKLFPALSEAERSHIFEQCCNSEQAYLREHGGILYPGLERVLAALSEKRPLFIVSNCGENYIQNFLAYYDFSHYFQDFEYYARTGREKSENIKTVIERHALQHPVYVGDTEGDRRATETAGIPFIFASYGFGQVTGYDAAIATVSELTTLF